MKVYIKLSICWTVKLLLLCVDADWRVDDGKNKVRVGLTQTHTQTYMHKARDINTEAV